MGTATAVAGRVDEQSRIFENVGNKVLAVGAKFPAINGVINAVRRKKSKVSWSGMDPFAGSAAHLWLAVFISHFVSAGYHHPCLRDLDMYCLHFDLLDQQALMDLDFLFAGKLS